MAETTGDRGGKITWLFRNENWPCRRAVFGLKISLEPWQKVVVSGGSMPQQRQRGSSQQTSSSFRTTAYIHPYTPPYLPYPPHYHSHSNDLLISIAIYAHPPFTFHSFTSGLWGRPRRSIFLSLSLFLSLPLPYLFSFFNPFQPPTISSFARGRSNTTTKRHDCTYENVTHIST